MRLAKTSHLNGVCEEAKHNPREVWKQLNSTIGWKSITSLKRGNNTLTTKKELASCFNQHFASVSKSLPPATYQGPNKTSSKFHFDTIQESEVLKLLSTLGVQKFTGHDSNSANLLKIVAPAISRSLTMLFNLSLQTGQFPSEWKLANITPVTKMGSCQLVSNYRPVSVLPVIAKVFE